MQHGQNVLLGFLVFIVVSTGSSPDCVTPGGPNVCTVYLPMILRPHYHTITLPIGINSGGPAIPLADGRSFEKDQPYSGTNGAGFIGGQAVTNEFVWENIDGTENDRLYRKARSGLFTYRFDVPDGSYIVELHLAEIHQHGPQFRVFDIDIEGQRVLSSLDLYALAQHDYAIQLRFAAQVEDGQLDVSFSATTGEPILSAIWVNRRAPDSQPPAAPAAIHTVGSYRRAIVRWPHVEEEDVAGYRVYRSSSQTGPYQLVTNELAPLARYFDDATTVGQSYCYTVSAVDLFGNEGPRSSIACATVVDDDASTLPVFDLAISAEDLHALAVDPFAEVEVPGTLTFEGQQFDVIAEYRGSTTQGSNKKGWKVVAPQEIPFAEQNTLLLNGEGYDSAMIREKVTCDLFDAIGIQPLQASFVHLDLNDQFIGVFTQIENPDVDFLRRTSRDPDGDIFKCRGDLNLAPYCTNEIVEGRGMEDLATFAAIVNRTPDEEFAAAIADVLDVGAFLDYQAINVATSASDNIHQFLLYHDTSDGRWFVLPWDNNVTFYEPTLPVDYGTAEHPGHFGQVNTLLTRVLHAPQYRRYFGERLLDLIQGPFSPSNMDDRLDSTKAQVWFDAERDVWKAYREDNDTVATMLSNLHGFVDRRVAYLETAVPEYMPAQARFIGLNELMAKNTHTIIDPADGQAEPWFEIVNAGLSPVNIGGLFLTNSLGAPTTYRIPDATLLPPLGSLLFWADNEPNQGPGHVNFRLSGSGGEVHLFDRDGSTRVDMATYPNLPADVSLGRFPDQSGQWLQLRQPTPGRLNRLIAPNLSELDQTPRFPQAGDVVTVTATIMDDGSVSSASLIFGPDVPVTVTPMADDGNHGDGAANDGRYGVQIPPLPLGTVVHYYLSATDDYGRTKLDPPAAPVLTHSYRVGYQPPTITISEFMAANDSTLEDPDEPGEYPDWIELSNTGAEPINLNGCFLTDDLQQTQTFRISADLIVSPGDTVVFFADSDPEQGSRHTTFKLRAEGEAVGLIDRDGVTSIDTVFFPAQAPDVAYAQCPVTMGQWGFLYVPTPGRANACSRRYLPAVNRQ